MRIAFLGWGSLIWDPRRLKTSGPWKRDGPLLRIEFARVSKDGKLTLVLHPEAEEVRVLWTLASCKNLRLAIKSLAEREGTSEENIGFLSILDKKHRCKTIPDVLPNIELWAKLKEVDAVVWTDLSTNFEERTKMRFNKENIIEYLRTLESRAWCRAEEYIRRAPEQIKTSIRAQLEAELGWHRRASGLLRIMRKERVWPKDVGDRMHFEKVHGRTEIFLCKVESNCSAPFWYHVPVSCDVVAIVAIDKDGNIYLVRQSRPAWDEKHHGVLGLPGGGVSPNLDKEALLREARRELREETGYECKNIEKLATVLCSGRIKSKQHIFFAEICEKREPEPEQSETLLGLHVESYELNKAIQIFLNREEETTGYTFLGLLMAREKLARKQR